MSDQPVIIPIREKYATMFATATIPLDKRKAVSDIVKKIASNRSIYETVAGKVRPVPWWVIAIIHNMECSLSFKKHLHNGDPLIARTVNVPAGMPKTGKPPFSWAESAVDAILYDDLDQVQSWSIGSTLDTLERYNGLGYRRRGVPSPYLWSFTNHYKSGKFVRDGVYDPNAVSKQAGCAAIIAGLMDAGEIPRSFS